MTAFVTLVVLLTVAGAALYLLPRLPGFPLEFPEIPLLFLALGAGVLWLLVLIFTLVKAACDRPGAMRWPRTFTSGTWPFRITDHLLGIPITCIAIIIDNIPDCTDNLKTVQPL